MDHETQRKIAKKLADTTGDSPKRRELFEEFRLELEAHANAEEQTLYAALIEKPEGQEKARHSIAEHKDAADLLKELEETDMSTGAWLLKFKVLHHEVTHHLEEEEQEVFVLARKLIVPQKSVWLADEFDERKLKEVSEMTP